jgi:hypothetical protein
MLIHWGQAELQLICLQGIAEEEHPMDNAHNKTIAMSRPAGSLVRLARRGVAVLLLSCAGIGAVSAQNSHRDDGQQVPRGERFQLPRDDGRDARAYDSRDGRSYDARAFDVREEQRRQAQLQQEQNMRNAENARRSSGRMTPDERRDLRRQINEAGMDLYPTNPRR